MATTSTNTQSTMNNSDAETTTISPPTPSPNFDLNNEVTPITTTQNHHQDSKQNDTITPYTCKVPNCKHPNFKDKSGLQRHKREVHTSQSYHCPISSCKRHTKGFNRAYNLYDHTKRCHPLATPGKPGLLSPRRAKATFRYSESDRTCSTQEQDSDEPMTPESNSAGAGGGVEEKRRYVGLSRKLESLLALRARIEADIQAVERTMEIL